MSALEVNVEALREVYPSSPGLYLTDIMGKFFFHLWCLLESGLKEIYPLSSQEFLVLVIPTLDKMKLNQINVSRNDYNKHWAGLKTKIMIYKGVIFLSPLH